MTIGLRSGRLVARAAAVAGLAALVSAGFTVASPAPAEAAGTPVYIQGHGWGHGRGMGQYGALGYAVTYGWSSAQILDHFYGGTVSGSVDNTEMTVELLSLQGKALVVTAPGLKVNATVVGAAAVRLTLQPNGTIKAEKGTGCVSAWTAIGTFVANATRVTTTAAPSSLDNLLRVCEATGERAYRGSLSVVTQGATQMTINYLPTESYLRGVVPRESPASWGSLGGGKGLQALRAQAVAARSYALASSRPSGARTCDTTACQVYGGAGFKTTSWAALEQPSTDTAISGTAGVVRLKNGVPARTEFSSSTGGWTAGGTFPAVEDAGDSTANNLYHNWEVPSTMEAIATALGTGAIAAIDLTRNGLGADGGRVTSVVVTSTSGTKTTFTGDQVRQKLSLKSNWFTFSGAPTTEIRAVVGALYQDLLGRTADPSGLATFSSLVSRTGSAKPAADALLASAERRNNEITSAYLSILGRSADASGRQTWQGFLATGGTVQAMRIRIMTSGEAVRHAGSDSAWVDVVYLDALNRHSGSAEVTFWLSVLHRTDRTTVARAIVTSAEAGRHAVDGIYRQMLDRAPDASGLSTFVPYARSGRENVIIRSVAGSGEYWRHAQSR